MRFAVKLIGTTAGNHIENGSRTMPLRGIIDVRLYAQFLDRFARQGNSHFVVRTSISIAGTRSSSNIVRNAIDSKIIPRFSHPVGAD